MNKDYKNNYKKLDKLPNEQINGIYIIPSEDYNGFWGKNGYKSYDFVFENNKGEVLRLDTLGRRCDSFGK